MARTAAQRTGHTDTRLLANVLDQVSALTQRVDGMDRVLAPAFMPRRDSPVSRGPGDHPREPYRMSQASTNSDPWASDPTHAPAFMEAVRNGTPLPELRRMEAQAVVQLAEQGQPSPVLWVTRDGKPLLDNGVTQAPQQRSVEHRPWSDYPDHMAPEFAADRRGAPPGFVTARGQAADLPGRPDPQRLPGL